MLSGARERRVVFFLHHFQSITRSILLSYLLLIGYMCLCLCHFKPSTSHFQQLHLCDFCHAGVALFLCLH